MDAEESLLDRRCAFVLCGKAAVCVDARVAGSIPVSGAETRRVALHGSQSKKFYLMAQDTSQPAFAANMLSTARSVTVWSRVAQWKRAGRPPTGQRSVDRNYALLRVFVWLSPESSLNNTRID